MNSGYQEEQQALRFGQITTVFVVIAALCYLAISRTNKITIAEWSVFGANLLTAEEITAAAGITIKDTLHHRKISLFEIESKVNKHIFIRNSQVSFYGINGVKIEVTERNPVFALVDKDGSLKYIDSDGNSLPYRLFAAATDVPLLYGVIENGKPESRLFRKGLQLVADLQQYVAYELMPQLGSIIWLRDKNCWQLDFDEHNVHILLGNMYDMHEQLGKLAVALREIPQPSELTMDLRWKDKIVCSKPD